jgi:uracil phosphoribosyltransferase
VVLVADEEFVAKVESDQEKVDVVVSAVDEECCWRQSPQVHS